MQGPQCWVTLARSDADGWAATVLAKSIRKTLTTRTLTIAISENVSQPMKFLLQREFNSVLRFDSSEVGDVQNGILWLWNLLSWTKCVYINPYSYMLENSDELFQKPAFSAVVDPNEITMFSDSLFVFTPSISEFDELVALQAKHEGNVSVILNNHYGGLVATMAHQIHDDVFLKINDNVISNVFGNNIGNIISLNEMSLKREAGWNNNATNEVGQKWIATFVHEVIPQIKDLKNESYKESLLSSLEEHQLPVFSGSAPTNLPLQDLGDLKNAIAVVGMSCRFPGANNADEFWDLLISGTDPIRRYPSDRPRLSHHTGKEESHFEAGFLKCAVDEFDAKFFGISPREAPFVDPQQRLLLEVIWESLENANINPQGLRESNTGVFLGIWQHDYNQHFPEFKFSANECHHRYLGNAYSATASRISHFLGLYGPNYAIESGCSSSLSAVHLACQSLHKRESTLAIASGVNLILFSDNSFGVHGANSIVFSNNFRCKTFDENADGLVRAEGCGAVVLKPLIDALRDDDNVLGLIRGTALNNDGPASSFGTPNAKAQERVFREALLDAGVEPRDVSVVEAHGTGTIVGDPTEMFAIGQVYSEGRTEPLLVSSVKTNIGHAESCAGMAGLIKILLCLKHKKVPPHLHFQNLNPRINLESIPAVIPTEVTEWKAEKRIAAVSSFSMTGTNVHLIVQETPQGINSVEKVITETNKKPLQMIGISAKSEEALDALCQKYISYLEQNPNVSVGDIAFTLNTGRANLSHRIAIVAKDTEQMISKLRNQMYVTGKATMEKPQLVFLFTGQGSQYFGMSKNLFEISSVFRSAVDRCEELFDKFLKCSLKDVLWGDAALLEKTIYCQPAIFSIQFALVQLWNSFGIFPDIVLGHSVGEFCAAVCAGALSLEDAMRLVVSRSKLVNSLENGKMLVVKTSPVNVQTLIQEFVYSSKGVWIDVAAENSNEEVVVSGTQDSVTEFAIFCETNGYKTQILKASHAFHSRQMDSISSEFGKFSSCILPDKLNCRYISGTLARELNECDFHPSYWIRHLRDTVRFCDAIKYVSGTIEGNKIFVEIGSQPILLSLTMANLPNSPGTFCPSLRKSENDLTCIFNSLSKMYIAGVKISWKNWFKKGTKISLPAYPFQRQKFWIRSEDDDIAVSPLLHPLLGRHLPVPFTEHVFSQLISTVELPYLVDHRVAERIMLPAAAYLEIIMAAGCHVLQECKVQVPFSVQNLQLQAALEISKSCQVHTIVRSVGENDGVKFEIGIHKQVSSVERDKWKRHAVASFSPSLQVTSAKNLNIEVMQENMTQTESIAEAYEAIAKTGIQFGPKFQSICKAWEGDKELLTEIEMPADSDSYICHPIVLDGMIQTFALRTALKSNENTQLQLQLPISIKKFTWFSKEPSQKMFAYSTWNSDLQKEGTVHLLTDKGVLLGVMEGLELFATTVPNFLRSLKTESNSLPAFMEEVWRPTNGVTRNRKNPENFKILASKYVESTLRSTAQIECDHPEGSKITNRIFALFLVRAVVECEWAWGKIGQKIMRKNWADAAPNLLLVTKTSKLMEILEEQDFLKNVEEGVFEVMKELPSLEQLEIEIEQLFKTDHRLIKEGTFSYEFTKRCGTFITPVLQGSVTPFTFLFPADPLEPGAVRSYAEGITLRDLSELGASLLLDCVTHAQNTPGVLRILEVGAGSGACTTYVLDGLQEQNISFEYKFTDISPLFLHEAKKKFTKGLTFALFNIEEDPMSQGFAPEEFDVILAVNVLHATADIRQTLRNLNLVLCQNGLLILGEPFKDVNIATLSFGFLDGWWRFTDNRKSSPLLDSKQWKSTFEETGFGHTEVWNIYYGLCGAVVGRKTQSQQTLQKIPKKSNTWLFVSDESEVEKRLKEKLELAERVYLDFGEDIPDGLEGVLFLWTTPIIYAESQQKCQQLLEFSQKFVTKFQESKVKPKFIVVTRGVNYLGDAGPGNPNSATAASFIRSFANELPDFSICSVDLDQNELNSDRELIELFAAICAKDKEMFKAIREDKIFVQRLVALDNRNVAISMPNSNRFKMTNPSSKSLSDLQISVATKVEPIEDELEVAIRATGLNFRDLFLILQPDGFHLSDDNNNEPGLEIAGIVTAIGPKCTKFQVGDGVFGLIPGGGLASHITVSSLMLIRKPPNMTFTSAATIPAVFMTLFYSLHDCAQLTARDRVLIHVATGGVGLAAIQMAKHVTAQIFATAGSRRKRAYLRSIGIEHVYHSRNTDFGDEILSDTNGIGVDVVLNSLTGPNFKEASLKTCAQNARFVEIGKINVWTREEVKAMRPDVKYFVIDFGDVCREDPAIFKKLTAAVEIEFKKCVYNGLPHETFSLDMIREAFFYFQKAKHIGKIVVTIPESKVSPEGRILFQNDLFHAQSTYLITGGLGGIGLEVAKWMAKSGARNLVLVGRNVPTVASQSIITQLNDNGCRVVAFQTDIGLYAECESLLKSITDLDFPPLRGIMHAAGVITDGIVMNQSWNKFEHVFQPKVRGTWNLHNLTLGYDLEFFTMFSSVMAIIGGPGQSNHAAANGFLDSFAHYRNSLGLLANSINFGAWSEVGIAEKLKISHDRLFGTRFFSPTQGIQSIEMLLRTHCRQAGVADVSDWKLVKQLTHLGHYLDLMRSNITENRTGVGECNTIIEKIHNASREDRQGNIEYFLEKVLKEGLRIPDNQQLDREENLSEIGVDSLMLMELRNRIQAMMPGKPVTVMALQSNRTIRSLSTHIANLINSEETLVLPIEVLVAQDSILPSDIHVTTNPPIKPSEFKQILLTGGTGHLGVNLIPALQFENPDLVIHCLVRAKDIENARDRLLETLRLYFLTEKVNVEKIQILAGDLSTKNFGLALDMYQNLAGSIDAIVHCAVKANHLEEYNSFGEGSLRSVNVEGTVNVLRFAGLGKTKAVLYASSLVAVTMKTEENMSLVEDYPSPEDTGLSIKNGYALSKFVCEKLMLQASQRGIPVTVIRYPAIFGNSKTGFMLTDNNHFWKILTSCIRVQKIPSIRQAGIPIVAVDTASYITAKIFLGDSMETGVYNLTSSSLISEEDIVTVFAEYGVDVAFVPFTEWRDIVFEKVDKNDLAPFVSLYGGDGKSSTQAYPGLHPLENQIPALKLDSVSEKVRKNCPEFERSIVPIDTLLKRYLQFYFEENRKI